MRWNRRERLFALLPRIFAAQPEDSAVGALLDGMAGRLAALDEATERVLRDRWVALAGGEPRWAEGPNPLERLGLALGIAQEAWEDVEAYRRRLRQSVPILLGGATTARSILALAAACLDTELCPKLRRLPDTQEARKAGLQDTLLGLGLRPGARALCSGCEDPGERCSFEPDQSQAPRSGESPIVARLLLTESPVTARSFHLRNLGHDSRFQVTNPSLIFDRPTLSLKAASAKLVYPALQNLESNELLLFAGSLEAGETLTLAPARTEPEVQPFDGYVPEGPALDLLLAPAGSAVVRGNGTSRDVSDRIFYLQGDVFDEAFFDVARFSLLGRRTLSPRLEPGINNWCLMGYTKADVAALADDSLRTALAGAPDGPFDGEDSSADLALDWWVRPPASFRLRIPEMPVRRPEDRPGVLELVRRTIDLARAAGVHATVDFPEPARREQHLLGEGTLRFEVTARAVESQRASDALSSVRITSTGQERQAQVDRRGLTTQGIFDVTRFDWSHLAPPNTQAHEEEER